MGMKRYSEIFLHRWLKVPYTLHVTQFRHPRRPRATVVLIHGLGNSSKSWQAIVEMLPKDIRIVGIDMLGFGKSPKPSWVTYDIPTQARAIAKTLLGLGLRQRPILVGHSMGCLASIELAKRFPLAIRQLVLCSPPLYRTTSSPTSRDERLRSLYREIRKYPGRLQRIAPLAARLGITSKAFDIKGTNADIYVAALEASIIHQTAFEDIQNLSIPISILYGTFDPVVIGSNISALGRTNENITAKSFPVGHEIIGNYEKIIASELTRLVGH